jgi:plasmid maintenance system killer protein
MRRIIGCISFKGIEKANGRRRYILGNWRLVFEFDGTDVVNVDLVDYH